MTRRVAVVDIGSTSVQMTIAQVDDTAISILEKRKHLARLADHLDSDGHLSELSIVGLLSTLSTLRDLAEKHQAQMAITATATLRAAKNRDEVMDRIYEQLKVPVRLLSGADEAAFVLKGVLFAHAALRDQDLLVLDVGGGSSEFITSRSGRPATIASVPIGSLVVHQKWLGFAETERKALRSARLNLNKRLKNALTISSTFPVDCLVGTGGTIQRLYRLIVGKELAANEIDGRIIELGALEDLIEKLSSAKTPAARRELAGIDPERADFLLGGALVFHVTMTFLKAERLIVSSSALRTGLLTDQAVFLN